jgi:hypothetical protein
MKKRLLSKRMERLVLLESPYLSEIDFRVATIILTLLGRKSDNEYFDLLIDDLVFGIDKFTDDGKRVIVMEETGFDEDKIISSIKRLSKKSIVGSQLIGRNTYRVF